MADRIIQDLGALALDLDWPEVGDLSPAVRIRIVDVTPRPGPRRWVAVAVAAAVLALVVLAVPAPREAIARWFGVAGVRVTETNERPPPIGNKPQLGTRIPLAEVIDSTRFAVSAPRDLPMPNAAYRGEPSEDAISLVWVPSDGLPPAGPAGGIGLLLTELPGITTRTLIDKEIGPDATIENVAVDGQAAFWITGNPHLLTYLDKDGGPRNDTVRLAANTLIWSRGGITYRLESALDRDGTIALAETMESLR